jgi:hypothetical protein
MNAPEETNPCIVGVPLPPAMCARDVLNDAVFAEALGYGWLHRENPAVQAAFVRAFREQVVRQAELYEQWLNRGGDPESPARQPVGGAHE